MSQNKKIALGTGVIAAIASSLCCIAPLIAILGGISGGASSISWVEPLRPYLIGVSAIALGYAFYKTYSKPKGDDCGCEVPQKKRFLNSKGFLWGITLFSLLMFTFPYYAHMFYSETSNTSITVMDRNLSEAVLTIDGMTCSGCEAHVNSILLDIDGIHEAEANFKSGTAHIKYSQEAELTHLDSIIKSETGYDLVSINTTKQ